MVLNSLNFCLSGKLLISPSNLNKSLAGQSVPGYSFFPLLTLNISCHSLWLVEFLLRNQLIILWEFPCTLSFFLCYFYYFIFVFNFYHFGYYLFWCVPPWVYPDRTLCSSWSWLTISFPKEFKLVNPKYSGSQPWIFIGRTDAEAEAPMLWLPEGEEPTHWRRAWCCEI